MMRRLLTVFALAGMTAGCSWSSAAMQGVTSGMNLSRQDTHLRIWLDGSRAEQNKLKKAATGYSEWKIEPQVSCTPKLKFELREPEKFGRITMVLASIYQEFQADYSHQAEFTIASRSQNPQDQMKPDTEYDLGNPPATYQITNLTGQTVSRVDLKPGLKYKLVLTVRADKSESANIEFKTK